MKRYDLREKIAQQMYKDRCGKEYLKMYPWKKATPENRSALRKEAESVLKVIEDHDLLKEVT